MKYALLLATFALSGCAFKKYDTPPPPPPPTEILVDKELVLVPCSEVVKLIDSDMDGAATEEDLEKKVFRLVRSDAQSRANLAVLKSAALKCGVKIEP